MNMFLRNLTKIFLIFLLAIVAFHFMNSLFTLMTTADIMLSSTIRLPVDRPNLVTIQTTRKEKLRSNLKTRSQIQGRNVMEPGHEYASTPVNGRTDAALNEDSINHDSTSEVHVEQESQIEEAESTVSLATNTNTTGQSDDVTLDEKSLLNEIEKRRATDLWKNMTTLEREQFQQIQVDSFCRRNNLMIRKHVNIGRQILINSKRKAAFCFVPKVGCTNLKILFFLTQEALPPSELFKSRDNVNQEILEQAISKFSLSGLTEDRKKNILQTYYKFVMYRNPIERLVSAYRSKVQRFPLVGLEYEKPHYNWLRMKIYSYKHPRDFHVWYADKGKTPIEISFSDFIEYWLHSKGLNNDEHFQSIYTLCQPCQVRYDYYGNFDTFEADGEILIQHMGSDNILLRDGYYQTGETTSDLAPEYYSSLSDEQKQLIITKLALDLSFYYNIFPIERDSHKIIMNTEFDVPLFVY